VLLGAARAASEDSAWHLAVRAYLASPLGSDTPAIVAERMHDVAHEQLWIRCCITDVHRLRELLEGQWCKAIVGTTA
jgi:hypothetical protein